MNFIHSSWFLIGLLKNGFHAVCVATSQDAEKLAVACFVSGHDFSRADEPFILSPRAGFSPRGDLPFDFFSSLL
ncbi:MAG: hypothetical protein WAL85_04940 [Candidatus Korobacteraceae bacterium]